MIFAFILISILVLNVKPLISFEICRYGLSFLPEQAGLRQWTFISAEAVAWMIKSIDGIDGKPSAVELGQVYHFQILLISNQTNSNFLSSIFTVYDDEKFKVLVVLSSFEIPIG